MVSRFRFSLVGRVTLIQIATFSLCWVCLLGTVFVNALHEQSGEFDKGLGVYAEALAQSCETNPDAAQLRPSLTGIQWLYENSATRFLAWKPQSRRHPHRFGTFWRIQCPASGLVLQSIGAEQMLNGHSSNGFFDFEQGAEAWRVAKVTSPSGRFIVTVAESHEARRTVLRRFFRMTALAFLAIMPIGCFLTYAACKAGVKPLSVFAKSVSGRDPKDLQAPWPDSRWEEIQPLVKALNGLRCRLSKQIEAQQRFLGDAAHELRTPVAAAEIQAHLLAKAETVEERGKFFEALQAALERAGSLVQRLLVLARLETGGEMAVSAQVNLAELCRSRMGPFLPKADDRGVELAVEAEGNFPLQCDPEALKSMVDNLIENAIIHGEVGGHVLLSLEKDRACYHLRVLDDGPGIPAQMRQQVFSRFFRLPGTKGRGHGLGLSIVQEAVEALGGTVEIESGLGGRGAGVHIQVPIHEAGHAV